MPKILKICLFQMLLISSISMGFAASSENSSVSVEKITPISQMVDPYFDSLVKTSGIDVNEQPLFHGSWSPDGSRLVVESFLNPMADTGLYAIYIMNVDGSGIRELASTQNNTKEKSLNLHIVDQETWSQDGSRIGIFTNIFTVRDFYVIADPDKTLIKTAGECNYTTVDEIRENILDLEWQKNFMWNPQGTKALILMDQEPLKDQLYLLDRDGYVLRQLTHTSNVGFACWSHDGKKIAYLAVQ